MSGIEAVIALQWLIITILCVLCSVNCWEKNRYKGAYDDLKRLNASRDRAERERRRI